MFKNQSKSLIFQSIYWFFNFCFWEFLSVQTDKNVARFARNILKLDLSELFLNIVYLIKSYFDIV